MFWSVTKIYFNGYSLKSYLTTRVFLKDKDFSKMYTWFKSLYIHKKKWRSTKGVFDLSSHSFTRVIRGDINEIFCYRTRAIVKIISDVLFKVFSSFCFLCTLSSFACLSIALRKIVISLACESFIFWIYHYIFFSLTCNIKKEK